MRGGVLAVMLLVAATGCASTDSSTGHASTAYPTHANVPFTPAAMPPTVIAAQPAAGAPFGELNGMPSLASTGEALRPLSTALSHDQWLEVGTVQLALTQLGSPDLAVDGYYGAQTASAVRRFQAARGIAVDGVAGRDTYRALIDALSELGGAVPAPAYNWAPAYSWTPGPVYTPAHSFGTICVDGWISSSTGSGTCSWHGGIR